MSDLNTENKDIKFPKRNYVGIIGRTDDNLPLGFMTEDGTDKAAQKRKATVEGWVNGNSRSRNGEKKVASFTSHENVPLIGFRLGRSIRRNSGWGAGNVKWRIEDPRGFELEISSPNMASIMDSSVIDKGEILEECVWARLKGDNVLVPINSDLYATVQRNDERVNSKVSTKDIERGDFVVLQNGTEGVYLGKFQSLGPNYRYDDERRKMFEFEWKSKPTHAMLVTTTQHGKENTHVQTFASFKPSFLTKREGGPLTPLEAEAMIWKANDERGYISDRLFLEQAPIVYAETDTTLAASMANENRSGHLVCIQGDVMYQVSLSKWQYDEHLANVAKAAAAPPVAPIGRPFVVGGYTRSRLVAQLTKVLKDDEGHYYTQTNRSNNFSNYGRSEVTIETLLTLPMKFITASVVSGDGVKRSLR